MIVLERLSLLEESQGVHRSDTACGCAGFFRCAAFILSCVGRFTVKFGDGAIELGVEIVSVRASLGTISRLPSHTAWDVRIEAVLLLEDASDGAASR